MRRCLRVTVAFLIVAGWSLMAGMADAGQAARAATAPSNPAAPTNDVCLACHSDTSLKRANNTPLTVDGAVFGGSIHAPLSCTDCHQDLATADLPHAETLGPAVCTGCHDAPQEAYAKGTHARARARDAGPSAGPSPAATCASCHGAHDIKPASDPASKTHPRNLVATCAACHGNAAVIARGHIAIGDVATLYHDSIHGKAREESGLVVAPSCVNCHHSHDILPKAEPTSPVSAAQVPATCGTCHEGILRQYEAGIHAAALKAANPAAPQCATCHTAHSIQHTDSEPWKLSATNECGTCHAQVVDSFRRTFHGKVTQLDYGRVATCADCHGAHDVRPAGDSASRIARTNLVATCRRCHEGANDRFVQYDPHPDPTNYARSPLLWWANRIYTVLIAGCFGFFALHSGLWFFRARRARQHGTSASRRTAQP